MKRAKNPSTVSMKLTSVPELPYKKGLLNSSPKPIEKHNAKLKHDKNEPMVLRSPPTGESIVRFALPIPLSKTKDIISNDEMVRRITTNLKMVVSTLENTYGALNEDKEKGAVKPEAEGLSFHNNKIKKNEKACYFYRVGVENQFSLPRCSSAVEYYQVVVGDDVKSFLLCCSEFTSQLEEAVKEERGVLESLYKWFQQQVNQMEEMSKDQSNLERELQSDGKTASLNIVQIAKLARKFEDIKGRLKERKAAMQAKQDQVFLITRDKELLFASLKHYGIIEQQIEDRVSLCSPGCPGAHSVDQAGLELRNPPASASQVLGLKTCATTARLFLNSSSD
ncbi:Coiled-coil domain-containing 7A [Apodemus speciosus]|uniref:Coiled-coil domain-containing 7A n=1 Tax=Apodemus speciosus TaxID=105296 RepID=A0ABQ0F3H8_APOSI